VPERHHLVKLVREGISVSEASRTLGISRKTAYKSLWRHDRWGVEGLSDRSCARWACPTFVDRLIMSFACASGKPVRT
jgi:transposase